MDEEDFEWEMDDEDVVVLPHAFIFEVSNLVTTNHRLVLDAINKSETDWLENQVPTYEDPFDQTRSQLKAFHDDLRRAATNLAVVALVTRLDHWITKLTKALPHRSQRQRLSGEPKLVSNLKLLNETLGDGPVSSEFFADLVIVRDSIVHADLQAKWEHRSKLRCVAKRYTNPYDEVELNQEQFDEARDKAIQAVQWYDERLKETLRETS